jgi:hypothetical protein
MYPELFSLHSGKRKEVNTLCDTVKAQPHYCESDDGTGNHESDIFSGRIHMHLTVLQLNDWRVKQIVSVRCVRECSVQLGENAARHCALQRERNMSARN